MSIQLTYKSPVDVRRVCLRSQASSSSSFSTISSSRGTTTTTGEDWAARRARLRRPAPSSHPPSSSRAVALPAKSFAAARRGLHLTPPSVPPTSSSSHLASTSQIIPYTREFHRSTAFTSSFTARYHDTSLEGVAVHDQRLRRRAALQENRLQRRQMECVHMRGLAIKYKNRAEQLRDRLRQDRQCQYACLTSAVRRLQAIFRRKQLLKKRQAEEARAAREAAEMVQAWGKRAMAVRMAQREIMRRKHAIQSRAAAKVIYQFVWEHWQIQQAQKKRRRLLEERRHRETQARQQVAQFGQAWFRGGQVRRRLAQERRQQEEEARAAAALAAAQEEERQQRRRKKKELHDKPFR